MSKIDKPFTPVFDDITQNPALGAMAGLVFGIVWRYCQMKQGVCFASVATISKRSGVSAPTVSKYLKQLVDAGYLVNTTPSVKGISHHYLLGDLADRYIKVEFGIELPQEWADELDDLPNFLEPPLKIFRTTSKEFDTKIVSKIEDKSKDEEKASSSPGGKTPPISPETKVPDKNGPTTPGAIEFFQQFKRKRWSTPQQQETFENTEAQVGSEIMLRAVAWAANLGIARVPAICTTAKKIAKDMAKDMERHTGPANGGGHIPSS